MYTIVKPAAEEGWLATTTLQLAGLSVALLAGFVIRQARTSNPLMPLHLFRSRDLVGANLIQMIGAAGMFGTFFLGSLYLQNIKHYDALEIGVAFLPVTVCMGVLSVRYSEKLVTRFGARSCALTGLTLMAVGLALFALAPADAAYLTQLLPTMVLLGLGAGVCFPALMGLAMTGVQPQQAGLASGLVNTTAQIGGALGLAVLATLATHRTQDLGGGATQVEALVGGYHLAFWIAAALVVTALALGTALLSRPTAVREEDVDDVAGVAELAA